MAETYLEKLKSPRWQKKRLEILQRDEFTCQQCLDKETTLHIHHFAYKKNYEPWDYEDDMLITLCENCHEAETHKRPELEKEIIQLIKEAKTNIYDLYEFIYYLKNCKDIPQDFYSLSKRTLKEVHNLK